ncbi:MAG TPA: hypothetical protein PKH70_04645, partial [Syntrophorhabdaceae bacterium]|nr:hypothetical protein [Syntrophorhabdaceae bacterium]
VRFPPPPPFDNPTQSNKVHKPVRNSGFFVTVNPRKLFIMLFVDTKVDVQYRYGGISMKKIPNAVYTRELGRRSNEDDNRGWNEGI